MHFCVNHYATLYARRESIGYTVYTTCTSASDDVGVCIMTVSCVMIASLRDTEMGWYYKVVLFGFGFQPTDSDRLPAWSEPQRAVRPPVWAGYTFRARSSVEAAWICYVTAGCIASMVTQLCAWICRLPVLGSFWFELSSFWRFIFNSYTRFFTALMLGLGGNAVGLVASNELLGQDQPRRIIRARSTVSATCSFNTRVQGTEASVPFQCSFCTLATLAPVERIFD